MQIFSYMIDMKDKWNAFDSYIEDFERQNTKHHDNLEHDDEAELVKINLNLKIDLNHYLLPKYS